MKRHVWCGSKAIIPSCAMFFGLLCISSSTCSSCYDMSVICVLSENEGKLELSIPALEKLIAVSIFNRPLNCISLQFRLYFSPTKMLFDIREVFIS